MSEPQNELRRMTEILLAHGWQGESTDQDFMTNASTWVCPAHREHPEQGFCAIMGIDQGDDGEPYAIIDFLCGARVWSKPSRGGYAFAETADELAEILETCEPNSK